MPYRNGPFGDITPRKSAALSIALNQHFARLLHTCFERIFNISDKSRLERLKVKDWWRRWVRRAFTYTIDKKDNFFGRHRALTKREMDIVVEKSVGPIWEYVQLVLWGKTHGEPVDNKGKDECEAKEQVIDGVGLEIEYDFFVNKVEVQQRAERAEVLNEIGFAEFFPEDYIT